MKKRKLKYFTTVIVLVSLLLTGGIFAYWATNVLGDETNTTTAITIGVGDESTTTVQLSKVTKTAGVLVPSGYEKDGSVSEIKVNYEVELVANDLGATDAVANLIVSLSPTPHPLLVITFTQSSSTIVVGGDRVEITVTITLQEPASLEEYNEVAGNDFEFLLIVKAEI